MEIKRFGNPAGKTMMLLHGNLMCWRQLEDVIPFLAKEYFVFAVSFDGFDGTGKTTYTNAQDQADKLADYVIEKLWRKPGSGVRGVAGLRACHIFRGEP